MLAILVAALAAEPHRAERVLANLDSTTYQTEERGIGLDVTFYTEPDVVLLHPLAGDSTAFDTSLIHRRAIGGRAVFSLKTMSGTPHAETAGSIAAGIRVEHFHRDSLLHGYIPPRSATDGDFVSGQMVDGYDTVSITTSLFLQGHWSARSYISMTAAVKPHLGLDLDLSVRGAEVREENFDPFLPVVKGAEMFHTDTYELGREEIAAAAIVSPGIGMGRRVNVTHLNAAFELERELKRCGAIAFSLADVTLAGIVSLLARNDSYTLKDLAVTRRFKAELDSILRTDAAVVPERLACLSPFVVRNLIVQQTPPVFIGGDIMLQARQRVDAEAFMERKHFPYRTEGEKRFRRRDVALGHAAMLGLRARWGKLLTRNWSVAARAEKRLFSSHDHFELHRDGDLDWQRTLETDWSVETAVWAGTMLRLDAGIDHLLCHLVIPREWPYGTHVGIEGFIEDYVSIKLSLAWHHGGENIDRSYPRWTSPFTPLRHGRVLHVRAVHVF